MKNIFLLFTFLLCVKASHAQVFSKDTIQQITLDTLTVSASAGSKIYRCAAPRVWEIRNTRIALVFNRQEKTADVKEWIKLHPWIYNTDTLQLDAKSLRIDTVLLVSKKINTSLSYTYENDLLKIHFGRLIHMSDSIELYLKYTALPYNEPAGGSNAITDDRGLYFINTDNSIPHKPAQIWTQGETESNSHWMITIDKPNSRFTTQVELTVPDSFTTLSNGAMIKQVKNVKGLRTDIWKMNLPIQAYAVMFAVGKFAVIKDHWKNKEVSYYVEPEYAPYAALMFKNTPEMIDYFSQLTGVPYPWNKYSQVVVRDYISGAMENTSATLCGEFMNQNAREIADRNFEDVVSHELFHQWFGDYVTAESWSNLTLNESFANYGEQLWRTHKYGKASGDELSYNDLQGYIIASQVNDPQLVRYYYDSREEVFDAITYNKGGAILRYLNALIGDAAFNKAMNLYLTKNALHSAEVCNWRMAVESVTGQDWNWFFNEWYYHAGHPVVKVVYNYNDSLQKLIVAVSQAQYESNFLYQIPLKAALIYGNDKKTIDWNLFKRADTFIYEYKNGKRPVIIPDYTHVLPGEVKDVKKPEQWLVQFMHGDDYISKRLAITAAGKQLSDSISQTIIDLALNDQLDSIRRFALSQIKKAQSDKYHKKWAPKLIAMANNDSCKQVRADAFGVLGTWKVSAAKRNMVQVLFDSSYTLAAAALDGLNKLDKDTAYTLAKLLLHTGPRANLEYTIWSIIGNKGADDDIFFYESKAPYVLGLKKITFAYSLNSYLKNVKSDVSFRKGVDVYAMLILNESMRNYKSSLEAFLFQIANEQKDDIKSGKKDEEETAKKRVDILKAALQRVLDIEKDPETIKEYKTKMKNTFE